MLSLVHDYSPMAGHPGERKLYATMRCKFYLQHLLINFQAYVTSCHKCLAKWVTQYTSHDEMNIFTTTNLLEFVAMDILSPLPTSTEKNQFILVISESFSKVTQTSLKNRDGIDLLQCVFLSVGTPLWGPLPCVDRPRKAICCTILSHPVRPPWR